MACVKEAKREELVFCELIHDAQTCKMTSKSIIRFIIIAYIFYNEEPSILYQLPIASFLDLFIT